MNDRDNAPLARRGLHLGYTRAPDRVYSDPAIYAREQEHLFRGRF